MAPTDIGDKLDAGVANFAERLTRRMSRRDAVRTGILGGIAGMASLTLGAKPAQAVICECGPTYRCGHYGWPCPSSGCPSGMALCKEGGSCSCNAGTYNQQGYCCTYSAGYWVACSGLCKGMGYKLCYDCKGHGCDRWCTCLSSTICCSCTSAADVREEHKRLQPFPTN
jgi:hypothetical protein